MQGSFARWLAAATLAALAGLVALGTTLALGTARADQLLDRATRSQEQRTIATRLQGDAMALLAADPALRRAATPALSRDLARYGRSIERETAHLPASTRAAQASEMDRARDLARLARRMTSPGEPLRPADATAFRATIGAIVAREESESAAVLADMRRLRSAGTLFAVLLPLVLAVLAIWFFATMRARLGGPLAALRAATTHLGSGNATPAIAGFAEFRPLADAFAGADREIARHRTQLLTLNADLERQVADRTATLAERNRRLAEIDGARRLFFTQVGHELRTPVTIIRGEAEVALRDPREDPAQLRQALRHVVAAGDLLGRRIDDLLALACAEDGRVALECRPVDLAMLVEKVARIASGHAAIAAATIEIDRDQGEVPVLGDASWLKQALLTLVDNAVKHAAHDGSRIVLTARTDDQGAVVAVADDGPGVAEHVLPHLFEAWYRATTHARGAGLGLAVARWVAEAHGGTIAAVNRPAGGLAVTLRLPSA